MQMQDISINRIANHPAFEHLLEYVAETISDGGRLRVDEHLADCALCTRDVRALWTLKDQFDEIWPAWNAEEQERIYRQMNLLEALDAEHANNPRIASWLKALEKSTQIGVKILIDRGKQIAGLAAGVLPGSFEYEHRPRVAGVGSPGLEVAVDAKVKQANSLLAQGLTSEALKEYADASLINSYATQSANSILYRTGKKYAEIIADGRRGSILIKYWPQDSGVKAEFVLLLPKDEGKRPQLATLRAVQGEEYVVAVFDDVGDGASDVIIGPDA